MLELLEKLIFQPGLSGFESPVGQFIVEQIKPHASVEVDPIGNVSASLGSGFPRMLFASHMDEIGMIVSHIEESGFLRIRKIGLLDDRVLIGRAVEVITPNGKVPGVIGLRPPHLMTSLDDYEKLRLVPTWDEIAIDVGASSREESERLGIQVMDPIIFKKDFLVLNGNRCSARALDDRFGCAVLIRAVEALAKESLDREVTFAWTVQEEIGAIGGQALAAQGQWDVMFAVDSYASADVPGVATHYGPSLLGNGPILRLMDHRSISTPRLAKWAMDLARKQDISLQFGPTGGYTDGQHFLAKGIPMLMLGIPVRYMHSPVEMIDLRDLGGLLRLILAIIGCDKQEMPDLMKA